MPKRACEYSLQDLYDAACQSRAAMFWSWCNALINVLGLGKTLEIMQNVGAESGRELARYWLSYWGVERMDTALAAETADIIHHQTGYQAPWTIISPKEAYETVTQCPINDLTPEKYKGKGIPQARCGAVTANLYPNLVAGTKVEITSGLCKGEKFCRFWIKPL